MKNKFLSKAVPRGTRTIWRYLGALFILFTFAIGNVWADSETVPKTTDNWTGTSCSLTHTECANGSANAKKDGDASDVTYIKFRTNKNGNTMTFEVNEGYKVTGFSIRGYANDNSKAVELTSVTYDSADPIAVGESFPNKSAGTTYTYSNTTDEATSAIVLSFGTNAGTQIMAVITITYEEVSSGPVDPTITFNDGAYTVGATALDLSTLFSSNSSGAVTYTVKTDGDTHATIDGNNFSATDAGTCVVTATQAAVDGTYNQKAVDANIVVSAAVTPACPSGLSISGTKDYTAGQTISLEAALEAGNGEITYNWYKGDDLATAKAAGSIGTGTSFSKASCTTSDAGNYFCVATKATCSDAESAAYAVTVAAAIDPWIIKVALSGDISSATKTVSGSIGGDAAYSGLQNSSAPYKIGGNSAYLNLTLATGYFYPGDSVVLDLSKTGQMFYGATNNDADHLLGTTTAKDGIHYFILPASFPANTNTIHVGRTGSTYNGTLSYMAVYRTPICPQTLTISGETDYVPGDKIELTASLAKGNGAITYQWYKGGTAEGDKLTGKTNAKLEIEDCVAGDAGDYYCIASKEDCSDAVNAAAYTISVNDFVAVTGITISPASPTVAAKSKITLTAEVAPAEATNKVLAWSVKSGSEAYASVNATTGEVTGKAEGNAVIVATATDGSGVFAEKTVVVTPFVCPTSGEIASVVYDLAKKPGSEQTIPGNSRINMTTYATVTNAVAYFGNTGGSGNAKVTTSKFKLGGSQAYAKLELDCALKEGDTIRLDNSTTIKLSLDTAKTAAITVSLASGKHDYIVPAEGDNLSTIFVWQNGSNVEFSYVKVIRPAKYDVTFNMQGHGTQVDPQSILGGGKVEEPATTDITGWDFGGWFTDAACSEGKEWAFATATVSQDTVLYAKWTEHVASNDVALGTLSVNGEAITIVPSQTVYAVELPMGTTATPTVTATANDENVKAFTITQATAVDGSATIYVKAEDNSTEATYSINFSVATSKDIELVWDKTKKRCDDTTPSDNVKSDDASVSAYINKITFTGGGAEGSSLNVGNTTGNMFTLSAKAGYAFQAMSFFGKIQDATCEYSLDGGAWTELASTKTDGDKCYANIFSAAEVHEFRLRSTGTSGVWIRNMQLTIVEACTPIVVAWDEEPVELEVGKAGYAIAATANNGGTITYASADNTIIDVNASTGALTIAGLGSVALSASTPEGDGSTYCANGGDPIVLSKTVKTYYLVKFDAQNGDAADELKYYSGDEAIALPDAPSYSGYDFQGWFDAETGGNQYTAAITPTASTTVYAQWVAQCAGATITTQPTGASYLTGRTPVALVCEATAGNGGELTYEWFTCDDEMRTNPVAATATPSTAVAGTFYYFCKVTEAGCAVEAFSNVVTITVADKDAICIIKSTPTSGTEAAVDGIYQGSAYFKGNASNKKLSNKYDYVAVELADDYTFQAGDKVVLNQTAAVSGTDITKFYVFTEVPADGKTYVTVDNAAPVQGDNWFEMPAELVGASALYIARINNAYCNPSVGYLAVYRPLPPVLNKVTVNGVEGKPNALNEIVIEVAASTSQSQLEAIAFDWISNNDAWTASHAPVAANAWEFGVANEVTFTDKDGDQSVYTITVNKAVPSSDATLSALSYGSPATAIALADGVYEYDILLPYGTSDVPALAATAHHAGATIESIDDATAFVDRKATSTVTVKAEDNATTQVYTVNFTVDRYETTVLWDGSTMSSLSDITAMDVATADISVEGKSASFEGKNYTKALNFGGNTKSTRYFGIVVPEGKVAKVSVVYRSRGNAARSIIIGTAIASAIDESAIVYATKENDTELLYKLTADIFAAGTIYINTTNGFQVFEIDVQLADGYGRSAMLGAGVLGTVCVPNNVAVEDIQGVTVYELMGRDYSNYGKIAFDEIVSGELEAGVPYLFQAHGNHMAMLYGETHVANPVDKHNGMYGTFEQIQLSGDQLDGVYYFAQKALWSCEGAVDLTIAANRAYVKLSEIPELNANQMNPAPGRRRVTMAVNGEKIATGCENLNVSDKPVKMIIDGQLFIIRGEKMYDAKGQLVK